MNESEFNNLSQGLISRYWKRFGDGETWNYFLDPCRFVKGDRWASLNDWQEAAETCIEKKINLVQALEVLLEIEFDKYIDLADEVVTEWHKSGAHDAYYFYDILSLFPQDNQIRKEFLGESEFREFLDENEEGYGQSARSALIRVDDKIFCEFIGNAIDEKILKGVEDEEMEDEILPLMVDLGKKSGQYLSSNSIEYAQHFMERYLDNDKRIADALLNGTLNDEARSLWIVDNAAYYSWSMGWEDILNDLKNSDWYWVASFSELWEGDENKNLLVWSMIDPNSMVRSNAIDVMKAGSIDGAIAWHRLSKSNT